MPDDLIDDPIAQEIAERRKLNQEMQDGVGMPARDTVADRIASRRRVVLASSINAGQQANPETRARAMELADSMRLPVDMVERNMSTVAAKARASQYDLDAIRSNHPQLADWLSSPNNAAVSNDDLSSLRQLDVATRALTGEDPSGILPHGFAFKEGAIIEPVGDGSLANEYKTLGDLRNELERRGNRDEIQRMDRQEKASKFNDRFGVASNLVAGMAQSINQTQQAVGTGTDQSDQTANDITQASIDLSPGYWGDFQRGVGGIVADLPLMLSGGGVLEGVSALTRLGRARSQVSALLKATAKGKGAEGAARLAGERALAELELGGAQRASLLTGRAADFAKAAAVSQPLAIREGITTGQDSGAVNGALSWLIESAVPGAFGHTGVEKYLIGGAHAPVADGWRGAVKRLLTDAGMEGSEEAVTEWAHAVHEKVSGINPNALDPDQLWHRLAVAGSVGAAAGAGFSLPAHIAEKFAREGEEAHQAEVYRDRMQYVVDQLTKSKTNGRSPAAVAELMGKTLSQGDGFTYVDASAFRDAHADPAAAAAAMGVGKEYGEALALGGKLQIPTVALLQRAAADPEAAKLLEHAARAPGAMTAAQAAEFTANAPDQVGKLHAEARRQAESAKAQTTDQSVDVARTVEAQLIKAGTPADTAKTQASVWGSTFSALSKRTGKPALELFNAYNVRIKRELPKLLRGEKYDHVDSMLDRIRSGDVPDDRAVHGPSLGDFLRIKGLRDLAYNGELKTLAESDRSRKPGEKNLVRDDGIALDEARMLAVDRGYFPENGTLAEFMTAIDNEVRGNAPSFADGQGDPNQGAVRDSLDQMEAALREAGVDIASATNKQAREALAMMLEKEQGDGKHLEQGDIAQADDSNEAMPKFKAAPSGWRLYYRIQPKGKGIDHKSEDSNNETLNLHVFTEPRQTLRPDGYRNDYGSEVVVIASDGHDDNGDVEGVGIDGSKAKIIGRMDFIKWDKFLAKVTGFTGEMNPGEDSPEREFIDHVAEKADDIEAAIAESGKDRRSDGPRISVDLKGNSFNQGSVVDAPKSGRLDLDALLRQWRKATGDRTSATSDQGWQTLVAKSDAVDAANGKSYEQPVYHGTPHKFDKFTTDHMGSGEGAQAFGWGLYFAESKEVANYYKDMLSIKSVVLFIDGVKYDGNRHDKSDVDQLIVDAWHSVGAASRTQKQVFQELKDRARGAFKEWKPKFKQALERLQSDAVKIETDKGRLYTVEIPDDGDYLLWGKPLKEQSENVQQAVDDAFRSSGNDEAISWLEVNQEHAATWRTAEETYVELSKVLGSDEAASKALLKFGAKGIKYLDGNSRSDGEGHHNYVIFDGADVAIKTYEQSLNQPGKKDPRGSIQFDRNRTTIRLFQAANLSTFLHESGHFFLEVMGNLASETNAPTDLAADYQQVRDWFGKNPDHIRSQAVDLALGNGAPDTVVVALRTFTDEQVASVAQGFKNVSPDGSAESYLKESMHEYFARGFEGYLLEGKAPQPSLRSAFARIKAWMVSIYRTIATLRVNLSPDIVDVFDRLVASEDATDAAEERAGTTNTLPASTFATAEEFDKYRIAVQASHDHARDHLEQQLIADYRKEALKAWNQQRDEIRAEAANEVNGKPVYQVIAALQRGEMPDGTKLPDEYQGAKLDRAELVREWGEDVLAKLPGPGEGKANRGVHVYAENGLPLSQVAHAWGFSDASTMIEAMIAAPDRRSLIDTTTTAKLNALVPDPMMDGSIAARADRALASDQRGELLAREMRALGQKTGQTPAPIAVLREVAYATIDRQKARDLRPDKYRMAAATAARRTAEAAGKQQWAEAYQFKQQEALNLEMYKASRDAVEAGEKGRTYLRTFDTIAKRQRIGKAGGWEFSVFEEDGTLVDSFATVEEAKASADSANGRTYRQTNGYLETINNILEGFQLRRPSNKSLRIRENVRKWMEKKAADGEPVDIDPAVIDDLGTVNWNDLTVEKQAAAVDAVRHVEHIAALANKLLKANREQELVDAREDLITNIVKHQPTARPDTITNDLPHRLVGSVVHYFEVHRKDSFLARKMDGHEAGGVSWEYFIRPRNEAAAAQESQNAIQAQAFSALFKQWVKGAGSFAHAIAGTNLKLTTEERICLALNWGNSEGRQRAMAYLMRHGKNASDAQAVLESLDEKDWELVNGMLRLINGHWSDIAALEQRVNGLRPEKVEALPFITKRGLQPGGYYPIKYDPKKSNKAGDLQAATEAKEMAQAAGARAQTRRGHTKFRAKAIDGLALRLDFGVPGEHIAEVVHDLTHREMLIDQNRLLRDGAISLTIKDHHGRGALDQLVNTAADIATGDRPGRSAAERFARALRVNSSAATFGANLTSALMNLTGFAQSMTRVGPGRMAWAVARVTRDAAHMESSATWVEDKSAFMANRANTLLREVADAARKVEVAGTLADIRRWGYYPMTQVQRVVDTITWMAAYDDALATLQKTGATIEEAEPKAVAMADQVVIDTQGSGRVGDLSAFQRGGEIAKLFTAFYSYFNVAANLQGEAIGRAWTNPKDPGNWLRLGTTTLLVWTLPTILGSLIRSFLQGDDRDEKKRWEHMAREQVSYGSGMLVGLREASSGIELAAMGYKGPAGLRGLGTMVDAAGQIAQLKADKGLLKATASAGGTLTGLPSVQANRLIDAIEQYEKDGNTWKAARRALFGAPRKE